MMTVVPFATAKKREGKKGVFRLRLGTTRLLASLAARIDGRQGETSM